MIREQLTIAVVAFAISFAGIIEVLERLLARAAALGHGKRRDGTT
jgi:hypothetical protein